MAKKQNDDDEFERLVREFIDNEIMSDDTPDGIGIPPVVDTVQDHLSHIALTLKALAPGFPVDAVGQ